MLGDKSDEEIYVCCKAYIETLRWPLEKILSTFSCAQDGADMHAWQQAHDGRMTSRDASKFMALGNSTNTFARVTERFKDRFKLTPREEMPEAMRWGMDNEAKGALAGVHAMEHIETNVGQRMEEMRTVRRLQPLTILSTGSALPEHPCPPGCPCNRAEAKASALLIHKILPWLGASPDALVLDPVGVNSNGESSIFGALEIKCPHSCKDGKPDEWRRSSKTGKSPIVPVCNKTTDVYRQIQWILAVLRSWTASEILSMLGIDFDGYLLANGIDSSDIEMHRDAVFDWADLVVWTPNGGTHVERIYADDEYWTEHLPKINRIYLNALLPEFACPRRPKAPVRGYRLDKGREIIINGNVEFATEWRYDSESGLMKNE
jgi:hypothetical protein